MHAQVDQPVLARFCSSCLLAPWLQRSPLRLACGKPHLAVCLPIELRGVCRKRRNKGRLVALGNRPKDGQLLRVSQGGAAQRMQHLWWGSMKATMVASPLAASAALQQALCNRVSCMQARLWSHRRHDRRETRNQRAPGSTLALPGVPSGCPPRRHGPRHSPAANSATISTHLRVQVSRQPSRQSRC